MRKKALIRYYTNARNWIAGTEFSKELDWQERILGSPVSEALFLREYAWVVLNSGFKEEIVRSKFFYISLCFCDWESASEIARNGEVCVETALATFSNRRKLQAIVDVSTHIVEVGFDEFFGVKSRNPTIEFQSLPFIGPITVWHLAKNLGFDVAKPDRHLLRLADKFGYDCVHRMCDELCAEVGERVAVADLVLWRFQERSHSLRSGNRREYLQLL